MAPGDLVVFTPDPLALGELLIIGRDPEGRLLCEAVHYEVESENDPPPRGVFAAADLELVEIWARCD